METIGVEELKERMDELGAGLTVIDVREPEEYGGGRIPGAMNIPLRQVPAARIGLMTMPNVHFVCATGNRSQAAAEFLASAGAGATNVAGGMLAWVNAGYAVER